MSWKKTEFLKISSKQMECQKSYSWHWRPSTLMFLKKKLFVCLVGAYTAYDWKRVSYSVVLVKQQLRTLQIKNVQ